MSDAGTNDAGAVQMNQNEEPGTGQNTRQRVQTNNNRNIPTMRIKNREFTGETPELGAILGLLTERLDNGVQFDKFQNKIKNYVLKNFKKAEDIMELIVELKDPTIFFESKHILADLTDEDEAKPAKIKMWEIRLKKYLDRKETLSENMHRLYGIIIRQCTPSL